MMVPFKDLVADARRKIDRDHAAQDREECRVLLLAHAPDFGPEDRAQMIAALMGAEKPAPGEGIRIVQVVDTNETDLESPHDEYWVGLPPHSRLCIVSGDAPVPDAGRAEAVKALVKAAEAAQLTLLNIDDRGLANTKPEAVAIGKTTSALLAAWPELAVPHAP